MSYSYDRVLLTEISDGWHRYARFVEARADAGILPILRELEELIDEEDMADEDGEGFTAHPVRCQRCGLQDWHLCRRYCRGCEQVVCVARCWVRTRCRDCHRGGDEAATGGDERASSSWQVQLEVTSNWR
jgi:hypothetical protein